MVASGAGVHRVCAREPVLGAPHIGAAGHVVSARTARAGRITARRGRNALR